jgi:integrase
MASLQVRNGWYHIRYRDKRGRSCSISLKLHVSPKNEILAQKKLIAFQVDLQRGQYPTLAPKIESLLDAVVTDYKINAKRSLDSLQGHLTHLKPWFGQIRADRFDAQDWRDYVAKRQNDGVKNATINRERAMLRRAFSLAYQSGKLDKVPFIPERLRENPPRAGFITREELEGLCRHLPDHLTVFVRFAFLTGWRLGEIRQLQWRHISFESGEIRLDPGSTKNGEGRVFPMTSELRALLDSLATAAKAARRQVMAEPGMPTILTPWVFHFNGQPIGWIYDSWDKARKQIGKPGLKFHDLRRSAVKAFLATGMPEKQAMLLVGHKTRSMLDRYNIVTNQELLEAKQFLERGQIVAGEAGNG